MSVQAMARVWDLDLPHAERLVLLALADHADHVGDNIYPSIGLIAWKTGYGERQVQRIIKSLVVMEILCVVEQPTGRTTVYRMDLSAGTVKKPYPRQNVTPDKMSPLTKRQGKPRQNVTPTPDIAMSPKPSVKPSVKPSNDDDMSPTSSATFVGWLIDLDVTRGFAISLAKKNPDLTTASITEWQSWMDQVNVDNPLGLMLKYLKEGKSTPPALRPTSYHRTNGKRVEMGEDPHMTLAQVNEIGRRNFDEMVASGELPKGSIYEPAR